MNSSNNRSYETVSEKELEPYEKANTYENFFDVLDQRELSKVEREYSSLRQQEINSGKLVFPDQDIDSLYQFKNLCKLHKHLFQDIYPWAGKLRAFDMAYGEHIFSEADKLVHYGEQVFEEFRIRCKEGFKDREEFIKESARFLNLINSLHPFPNGNGRTQRSFMEFHFNHFGFQFDWAKIHQWEIYATLERSFVKDMEPLERLIDKHLSPL